MSWNRFCLLFVAMLAVLLTAGLPPTQPLVISPPSATVGPLGKIVFQASGGQPPFSFSLTHNLSGGMVGTAGQYTAGSIGNVTDTVTVTDAEQNRASATIRVGAAIAVVPQDANVAAGATLDFSATGGAGAPYTWSTTGGTITGDGVLTAPGNAGQVTVTATDKSGAIATSVVVVGRGVSIAPTDETIATHGTVQFTASGGTGSGYEYTLITNPPTGATINASTGLYTAGSAADVTDQVELQDSAGTKSIATVHVIQGLVLTAYGTTNVGAGAHVQFTAAGGSGQGFVFSVPVDPSGGTIDAATGLYTSGRNSGIDTVRVTDSAGNQATQTVQVTALPGEGSAAGVDGGLDVPGSSSGAVTNTVTVGGGDDGCNGSGGAPSGLAGMLLGLALLAARSRRGAARRET